MSNTRSRHKAIGPQIGANQRLTEQLTTKQAIQLSEAKNNKIPLLVCSAPKTWIMVDADADMEAKRVEYRNIHEPERVVLLIVSVCKVRYKIQS